jgi:hypothetical protein
LPDSRCDKASLTRENGNSSTTGSMARRLQKSSILTSAIITVEVFADTNTDTDDGDDISCYFYGPFQTFSEKLPYVPSYLKLMRLLFTKSFFVDA